jgi:hypothetical protein
MTCAKAPSVSAPTATTCCDSTIGAPAASGSPRTSAAARRRRRATALSASGRPRRVTNAQPPQRRQRRASPAPPRGTRHDRRHHRHRAAPRNSWHQWSWVAAGDRDRDQGDREDQQRLAAVAGALDEPQRHASLRERPQGLDAFGCEPVADLITPAGIAAAWPFAKRRVSVALIRRSGDWRESVLVLLTAAVTVAVAWSTR